MSNFQVATIEDRFDLGTGTDVSETVKLPTAHPISRIYIRERATHATSVDISQDRIEVLVDGSPILSGLSGQDVSKLTKYDTGRQFALDPSAGTDVTIEQVLNFGRFPRDEAWFLPAPLFSTVQLRLESTLTAAPTLHELDVVVEELLGVNAQGGVIRKRSLVNTYSPNADQQVDTELPVGNPLSAVYVDYAGVENVDGRELEFGVNNFSRRIFQARRETLEALNRQTYPFHDDTIPVTMVALDMDVMGSAGQALATKGLDEVELRTVAAGSGTSGTVRVIAEELIPVS